MMLDVCVMNYLEACQMLLGLSSSSGQFHISKTWEGKFKRSLNMLQSFILSNYKKNMVSNLLVIQIHAISLKVFVPYRQQLSDQHVRGFLRYVSHKHCGGGAAVVVFFGSHGDEVLLNKRRFTDHRHRRHHDCRGWGHDAHMNWDHWSSCKGSQRKYESTWDRAVCVKSQ